MFPNYVRLALAAAALLLVGAGDASAATVARPVTPTQVREYQGTIVFSQYDLASNSWLLYTRGQNAQPRRVPVPASPTPFDADIGTDTKGRPALIYQRCLTFGELHSDTFIISHVPTRCDLYTYSLVPGGGERPVRNANDSAHDDMNATIWRGRIAWSRRFDSGAIVYTKLLTAPRSRPSTRLSGVPEQRCIENPRRCATTADRMVSALELLGDLLALTVSYTCRSCGGISESQLRLDDVRLGTAKRIWRIASGLSGQTILGPSLVDGKLGWYDGCSVNEPSCRKFAGPYRYDLSTEKYTHAPGPIVVQDFADAGAELYEVLDGITPQEAQSRTSTGRIEELPAPAYVATEPRL